MLEARRGIENSLSVNTVKCCIDELAEYIKTQVL
jgi:hypothetical protein